MAAASLLPFAIAGQTASGSAKALVYCPVGIDAVGCTNISAALASTFTGGVDLGYDGSEGTVDLRTADLWQYEVFVVPSLADLTGATPYALLRDAVVAERLHDALMGRVAMWSGTPDLGSATSPNRDQKNALIVNLARWAAGNYTTVKGPGLVTFLDQSEAATERYDWARGLTGLNVIADSKLASYEAVAALTPTATSILSNGDALFAYTNMASFGLQTPSGAPGVSMDAIGQTGTTVGGQVVMLTSPGGNSGGAIVWTDLDDYAPGTTVIMSGSGWQPGETVSLTLHEDPMVDPDRTFTTVADASGNIEFTGFAPEPHNVDVRFILTATGGSSNLRAQTTFTDGIAFAGSTTADNGAGATSLTIGKPADVVAGDVLLAQVTFYGGNLVTTPPAPAGWALVNHDNSGSTIGQAIYSKIAGKSEPTQYSWSFGSTARKAVGGIVRYSGADVVTDTNPVAAWAFKSGTAPGGTVTSLVAPSVATKTRNSMVVTFFSHRGNMGLSTPLMMTQRHQRANPSSSTPLGPTIMASEIEQFDVAETGEYTSTANASGAWVAHTIVLDWRQNSTNVTSPAPKLTLARPGDATPGDLMLASITTRSDATVTITAPAGWEPIAHQTMAGTQLGHATYWKVAQASDPASFDWGFSPNARAAGGITAYSDMDIDAGVIDVSGVDQNLTGTSTSAVAPSVMTTAPGDVIVALYALDANVVITPPTGMLLRYHASTNGNTKAIAVDGLQSAAGATGTKALTLTSPSTGAPATARWFAQTVAMRRRPVPAKLGFTTPAYSGIVNACLGPITVQTRDAHDRPAKVMTDLSVSFVTSGTGQFFPAAGCATPATTNLTIAAGTNSVSVWYTPLVLGTGVHQVSAAASGVAGASQDQTVGPDPEAPAPASVKATLVNSVETSKYSPPSPDPSGLAYATHLHRLVIVDGEVDEMPSLYGGNVFFTTLSGSLDFARKTPSYTSEAVGATYNPANKHLFLADDDKKKVFEIDAGTDGDYFTGDDRVTSFDTGPFGNNDPEGLAFDIHQGVLFIADGSGRRVFRVAPGANGVFDGVAPVGDDQVTSFDTEVHGLKDPEGIAYDSDLRNLYVVGTPRSRVFRISTTGVLLGTIDISATNAVVPAGLEYVPTSAGAAAGLYIAARGVDNDTDPNENDGKLYQVHVPSFAPNTLPEVTITSPTNGSSYTQGTAITFTGTASDAEDGSLTAALTWRSSLSGALGQGGVVSTSGLAVGTHTITASATDSRSAEASASITVTVNKLVIETAITNITATPSMYGGTTTLSATVSPAAPGAVTFIVGAINNSIVSSYDAATGVATVSNHLHGLDADPNGYAVSAVFTPATGDYALSSNRVVGALQVAQAPQTITFDLAGVTAKYGDAPFAIATRATGGASGNAVTFTGASPATCAVTSAGEVTIAATGLCTITASQAGNTNYSAATSVSSSFTISPRLLTVSATGDSKIYDGNTLATVVLTDDRADGDDLSLEYDEARFADKNVGTGKPISVNGISLSGPAAANYTFNTTTTASADIVTKPLTVRATGVDKTYDGTTDASVTLSDDRIGGDVVTASYTRAEFEDRNAGDGKGISVTGITIAGADARNYIANVAASASAKITPAQVTGSIVADDRIYDGTTDAVAREKAVSGLIGNDAVGLIITNARFDDRSVGMRTVTADIGLMGGEAANYSLTGTTASASAQITPKALIGSFTAASKVYDGTTAAEVAAQSLPGVVGADVVVVAVRAPIFDNRNVGVNRTVTAGLELTGADAGNYTVNPTAMSQADITVRTLTVSATGSSRPYDGTTAATVSLGDDRIPNDDVNAAYAVAAFDTKSVGPSKPISVSGISISGADAGNYMANATATTVGAITPRALVVTAMGVDKTYDGTTAATVTLANDRVRGDDVDAGYTRAAFADANVGTGKAIDVSGISLSGADAANYSFNATTTTTASIAAREIGVSADAHEKVYGEPDPTLTYRISSGALVNGDALEGTLARSAGEKVTDSPYAIYQGTLSAGANYLLRFDGANLTITARPVTAAITAANKVYDGNTSAAATGVVVGAIAEDDIALQVGDASFSDKNAGTAKTVTAERLALSGADAANYALASSTATTTADIARMPLVVRASAENKVYDGTTAAVATLSAEPVAGDAVTVVAGSASFADANVGTKTVTVTGFALVGADAANYVANEPATATATILARPITVTADPKTKMYGAADPALTYAVTTGSLVDGETLEGSLDRAAGENVTDAPYAIGKGSLSAGSNYALTFVGAGLAVTPRPVTATAVASNKVYDGNTSAAITSSAVIGAMASDDVGLELAPATFSDRNVGKSKLVTVEIALTGAAARNYVLGSATATATAEITARPLAITASAQSKVYDGGVAALVTLSDDRVEGDALETSYTGASFADKHVATGKTVTVDGISLGGADAGNYMFNSRAVASAAITQRALVVSAVGVDKVYDGTRAAAVTLSDDRVAGDALAVHHTSATFADENVGTAKPVAVGGIALSGADAGNYTFNSEAGTAANITPLSVTASLVASDKVYDGTTTAVTVVSLDGAIPNDDVRVSANPAQFANKHVGTGKAVSAAGIALTGADAGNYQLASSEAVATASITPRPLAITATAASKVYDGTTATTATLTDDRVAGDALSTTYAAASFADPNAGIGKAVLVSGIAIGGADAGNYTAPTAAQAVADITPASATITLGNLSQRWDGAVKAVTAATTPASLGVTVTYSQNGVVVASPKNAGFYDVVATITDPNHRGTATATLVILNLVDVMPSNSMNIIYLSDTKTTDIVAAFLGTVTFDVRTVAPATVTLGDGVDTDAPVSTTSTGTLRASISDVNADGRADLVMYFKRSTVLSLGNVTTQTKELTLRGALTTGAPIRGSDKVTVYP